MPTVVLPSSSDRTAAEPTLEDVRAHIPDACYERSNARGLALAARDTVLWAVTLAFAARTHSVVGSLALSLLAGLFVAGMFVLGHDAAHLALLPDRNRNRFVALLLMLPSMHVREAWELGHNRVHHGFTVRRGTDFVWHPSSPEEFAAMSRLARLRHRLEWSFLGSGLYYLRDVWWNKMMSFEPPERYAEGIKRDRRVIYAWALVSTGAAFSLGAFTHIGGNGGIVAGIWMAVKLVVIPFLVFTHTIGFTVHVHHVQPDLKWHERREWTKYRAQMEGTTILRMPRILDALFFHNIFVHVPHHVDMRIPCYHLEEAATAIEQAFPDVVTDRRFRIRDYVRATRTCKLYDFELGHWVPYSAAAAVASAGRAA